MGIRLAVLLAIACVAATVKGYEWTNLTPENRLGGRMVSAGYLRGKVVLLDCRDYGDKANFEDIRQLQSLWASYKTKPFVVIGSHIGTQDAKRMEAIVERLGVTYPVYANAGFKGQKTDALPAVHVFDSTGQNRLYRGNDVHKASGVAGTAIFAVRMPSSLRQWKTLLDYEIANLPGQALLRLKALADDAKVKAELRVDSPADFKRYVEAAAKLKKDDEIVQLAKLVEFSRTVKDRDAKAAGGSAITKSEVRKAIERNESLKKSSNPSVVQEAKNALADLKFAEATLDK